MYLQFTERQLSTISLAFHCQSSRLQFQDRFATTSAELKSSSLFRHTSAACETQIRFWKLYLIHFNGRWVYTDGFSILAEDLVVFMLRTVTAGERNSCQPIRRLGEKMVGCMYEEWIQSGCDRTGCWSCDCGWDHSGGRRPRVMG